MSAGTGYEVITFDCYGTLIDREAGLLEAFAREAMDRDADASGDEVLGLYAEIEPVVEQETYRRYRDVLAITASRVASRLGWPEGDDGFLARGLPSWQPFPDTNPALVSLVRAGVRLGILSNVDRDLIDGTLVHLRAPFDPLVTAEDVRAYKPAHRHFTVARERLHGLRWLHAAQSHFHDVAPCIELGIDVVWVNRKGERSRTPGPTAEVADLTGLVGWVSGAHR
jgi:2-haloalkanoic acid dehalogenase type II